MAVQERVVDRGRCAAPEVLGEGESVVVVEPAADRTETSISAPSMRPRAFIGTTIADAMPSSRSTRGSPRCVRFAAAVRR